MDILSSEFVNQDAETRESPRNISSDNIEVLLQGASILSGGGGGNYDTALERYRSISPSPVNVKDLSEFCDDDTLATVFGLGPVENQVDDQLSIASKSVRLFEERYSEVDGFVLGEVGPDLIVEAALAANELGAAVVDADVAGMRAVPSIQNEIIEATSISRTPLVATNGEDTLSIESGSGREIEARLRDLSTHDLWYVTGYANPPSDYSAAVQGWFDECVKFDRANISRLGEGRVYSTETTQSQGHSVGRIRVQGSRNFEIFLLNENIIAFRDGEAISQAPDTICILDERGIGISNGNLPETGERVEIYELTYNFWQNAKCLNLESLGVQLQDGQIEFESGLTFEVSQYTK